MISTEAKVATELAQATLIDNGWRINLNNSPVSPLVSIVIPVFNGMPYLIDLVDSIFAQTYSPIEIVFSEGGGTDSSLEYLRTLHDPRVRIVEMPSGTTAAENWTSASQSATGEFVKLVCQDDLLATDAIERQVKDLQDQPTAVMAFAQRDIVDASGRVVYTRRGCSGLKSGLMPGNDLIKETYLRGMNIIGEPVAVLFRRQPLLDAMPWDGSNPLMLDISCYQKVATNQFVVVRKQSVGAFRVSTSSWSTRLTKVQLHQFRSWQDAYFISAIPKPSKRDQRKAVANAQIQTLLRRSAYAWLRLRGSFVSQTELDRG
ncbi:MAG: glycosyltransferase [Actinobacteria bacterium]|nr:glycosyltransferase [Actinomycetota bacterium]